MRRNRSRLFFVLCLLLACLGLGIALTACNGEVGSNATPAVFPISSARAPTNPDNKGALTPSAQAMAVLGGHLTATAQAAPTTAAAAQGTTGSGGGSAISPDKGDAQAGLAKFQSTGCTACHANNGKTAGVGPSLVGVLSRRSVDYIVGNIRNGRNAMPAFTTAQVSDQDISNILAYLKTLT